MNKENIIEFLEENELEDIKEIDYNKDFLVVKFCYYYDEVELEGAKDFALSQGNSENEENWKEEFYIPYLNDMAEDNVLDIIEDISDEDSIIGKYVLNKNIEQGSEFIGVFSKKEFDIEDILKKI